MRTLVLLLSVVCLFALLSACSGGDPKQGSALGHGRYPDDPPLPALPRVEGEACRIDLDAHGIANDATNPEETTDGLNRAIATLAAAGCGTVQLPAGTYSIGKRLSDSYTGGIELPSGIVFELDDGATLQLHPTDTWAYCVVAVRAARDVVIRGGAIVGDRHEHDFRVEGEEGHCICIENESERILVEGTKLSEAIGDGVLIVGQGGKGSSSKDVTIRGNEIFDNRRQGISIVGGVRILIEGNEIHHIQGTAPQFGVDIESLDYESRDITVRGNHFHHNRGGDFVNTDGRGVLVEGNTMEDGEGNQYIDGPLIFWSNTDQIVRDNHIRMVRGSANGKMGILEYSHRAPRSNPTRNVIEGNTLEGCSINVQHDSLVTIRRNRVRGPNAAYILYHVDGLELFDNVLEKDGWSYSYMIHESSGTAAGNTLNGKPYEIPMVPGEPFSNWDGN